MRRRAIRGFALVELLIFVVVLVVLAAVIAPQFSDSTDEAMRTRAEFNLGTLRSVIHTFRSQHGGVNPAFPEGASTIEALAHETDDAGIVKAGGGFGPYLVDMLENPYTGRATVKASANAGTPPVASQITANQAGGWIYDATTGNIWLDSNTQGEFTW